METRTVKVPNVGCNGCVNTIKGELSELPGVVSVSGDADAKTITVNWQDPATWNTIKNKMAEIDYAPAEA
jgi:copper chaperone